MKGNKVEKILLHGTMIFSVIILAILLRRKKTSIKDWILAYLINGFTNGIIDHVLTTHKKVLKYPVRYFPKLFKLNVAFDFLVYPTFTVFFNQWTDKDKPKAILFKLLTLTVPLNLLELLIEKKTNLVTWRKGWKWYYSFVAMTMKSLITKGFVVFVGKVSDKQNNYLK
ncbi:CBO0543 family protein [Salicibibacter kimchii]|uniref:Uncharacterized protein n=1 Tax=Salicibibacter kimchii TaxID=2099786 RepID=A0A345C2K3_9BACI|nr:CBO0543 family protein [Salicibibacter kimchii]AXF57434.1 hypothetical protein DT065_16540 [Salicibibacter kimchii]